MDKKVAEHILKWHYESDLNFIKLLDFINNGNIPVVDSKLISAVGMATYYEIHLDLDNLDLVNLILLIVNKLVLDKSLFII